MRAHLLKGMTAILVLSSVSLSDAEPLQFATRPWLQYLSRDSVAVFFETEKPVAVVVEYGKGQAMDKNESGKANTSHRLVLSGLEPATACSYRIKAGSAQTQAVSETYEFDTTFNFTPYSVPPVGNSYTADPAAQLYARAAEQILRRTGVTKGYCLVLGCGKGQLAYELAKRSDLTVIGVDEDTGNIAEARKRLQAAGVYGTRITVRQVPARGAPLPFTGCFANLVVSESMMAQGKCPGDASEMFRVLRPQGGVACLGPNKTVGKDTVQQWLNAAGLKYEIEDSQDGLWFTVKRGPLPGVAWWSHQYGDAGNSGCSGETLQGVTGVGDMAIQWFGQPGADFGLDRNPRMPAPLATNGRLFHQGMNRLVALDCYNGAVLWSLEIPDLRRVNMPRDAGNWCADDDSLFVAVKEKCLAFDARDGRLVSAWGLPDARLRPTHEWGYVARAGDKLYGSSVRKGAAYTEFRGGIGWYDGRDGAGTEKVCSDDLFAVEKDTDKVAWRYANGVIINTTIAIGGGRVYFVESRNAQLKASDSRRVGSPLLWSDQYLVALDANTGAKLWEQKLAVEPGVTVFYLIYADGALVIASSASGKYNLYCYEAADGRLRWQAGHDWLSNNHGAHMQHPVVAANMLFVKPRCYDTKTGAATAKLIPQGSCGTVAGTRHALVFRTGAVQMWDIASAKLSGWDFLRPSCWLSTVPAGGMVLSPEGGGGCSCGLWMEISCGFLPKKSGNASKETPQ